MGKININKGVGIHSNHSCLNLPVYVWVYGVMDKMPPSLLISIISDFFIVEKPILNSKELLLLPWVPGPPLSLIYGPSLSLLMCLPPFSILLQLLCSFFVLVFFLLYWAHYPPTLLSDLIETLTLHFLLSPLMQLWKPCQSALLYCLSLCL